MEGQRETSRYRDLRDHLEHRTKRFAIEIVRIVGSLPAGQSSAIIGKQLLRSATAVGANYRSASRARSKADFVSKIGIAEEEADESQYWLELLSEVNLISASDFVRLHREAQELTAIFVASGRTAKFGRNEAR